jgi:hypothetical protein
MFAAYCCPLHVVHKRAMLVPVSYVMSFVYGTRLSQTGLPSWVLRPMQPSLKVRPFGLMYRGVICHRRSSK